MRRNQAAADGSCLFHALGWLLNKAGVPVEDGKAVRMAICEKIKAEESLFAKLWNMLDSEGVACLSWKKYGEHMKKLISRGGELEILAAALEWNLQVFIWSQEPSGGGEPTIYRIGASGIGTKKIWLLYNPSGRGHYDALDMHSSDERLKAARIKLEKSVHPDNVLSSRSTKHFSQWSLF